jgi:hypothetical protein
VAGSCEYGYEPLGYGATELVSWLVNRRLIPNDQRLQNKGLSVISLQHRVFPWIVTGTSLLNRQYIYVLL